MTWRLDPRCELAVLAGPTVPGSEHEDLGCGLQGPASNAVRRALDPLRARIRKLGAEAALPRAEELTRWIEKQPDYSALCSSRMAGGRRRLKDSVVYGASERLVPRMLQIRHARSGADYVALETPVSDWSATHDLLSMMMMGASPSAITRLSRQTEQTDLLADLTEAGWLTEQDGPDPVRRSETAGPGTWFVGHNSVVVASAKTRILVDPWFRPWRDADPADYRPLRPVDIGQVDAIAITHSHGDHFHLGSLLAFPRDTPILVPAVARESMLATDLERRLREVGFTRVRSMRWWESARVGDVTVHAMPFFGEQASTIDLVDPALRNIGNTWMIDAGSFRAALLADTGRDPLGDMQTVALEARRRWGTADVVFGTMRGFALCPLMLPFTTLDAMFVNAPLEVMAVRQKLMNDANDLVTVGELFGARHVVPYADGGAPWYYREGMGPAYKGYPTYPGERVAPKRDQEEPDSAPFPERIEEIARARQGLVLRPGDVTRWSSRAPTVRTVRGFGWLYSS